MQKNLLFLLACLLAAVPARAQLIFATNSGSITITGFAGSPTILAIPSTTNNYTVTGIAAGAFDNKSTLKSVTIPNTITNIGAQAFQNCQGLTNATMGNSVITIGDQAFAYVGLTSVTLPNSVTTIGNRTFDNCESLTNLTIGSGVTSIGQYAFYFCTILPRVTLPNNVTSIGVGSFDNCYALASVTIPGNVTNIGQTAFSYCTGLTNITVVPQNSFYRSVNGVLFDKSQTTLFQYPAGLTGGYTISNGVTRLGPDAFQGCAGLTNLTIPGSVTNVGNAPFYGCNHLMMISVASRNLTYSSQAGVLFSKDQRTIIQYPPAAGDSYTIANSVLTIGDDAFASANLTNVTIPNSVTNLGTGAFEDCFYLGTVTIGNGLIGIGDNAFDTCESLTNVTMGNSVNTIGIDAFEYCYDLAAITIPNSVTAIGAGAFYDCDSLTNIYFLGNAPAVYFNGPPCCEVSLFYNDDNGTGYDPTTVYYLSGTYGWSPIYVGVPTALWNVPTAGFTANPVAGTVPLAVQFGSPEVDSGGNLITRWNWSFGDGATSSSQNPAHSNPTHVYTATGTFYPDLIATNSLGATVYGVGRAITVNPGPVFSGLVVNGGFETGDFTGWTLSGDTSYTYVDNGSAFTPFSGNYAIALGTSGSLGWISQTLATTPGATYLLSFWLTNPYDDPGAFLVSWNGSTLLNDVNPAADDWTNMQFTVSATGASTVLQFGFQDDANFFGLDGIGVTLLPVVLSAPRITAAKSSFTFMLSGPAGSNYILQVSTNLLNWSPVSTSTVPASGTLNLTNASTGYNRRFYRVHQQ